MIPIRYYSNIRAGAVLWLRYGGPEGERRAVELLAQLRNAAQNEQTDRADRIRAFEQYTDLNALLTRHRRQRAPDDGGPTPEAKAKAKRRGEAIGNLHAQGTLSKQQVDAAEHILSGYRLTVGDVGKVGMFRYEPPTEAGEAGDWTVGQIACYRRYHKWHHDCLVKGLPMDPIMTLIVDAVGVREIERRHGMTNGSLTPKLCEALSLYCGLVGWATERAA